MIIFECSKCGAQQPKWTGRCLECGNWGTVSEGTKSAPQASKSLSNGIVREITDLSKLQNKDLQRDDTNMAELDRVLGGGLVKGSLVLLGGDPGIGKSTLALQIAAQIKGSIYISGEESAEQVAQRLQRLSTTQTINFIAETNLDNILSTLHKEKPTVAIIDSIQTIYSGEVNGEAGNISQVRSSTVKLLELAKSTNITIIIVGHVTKEGVVAGPKTLEHLVDTVLYLEGDKYQQYRLLRAVKNRFGQTGEVGIWEMTNNGLKEVLNPSEIFLKAHKNVSGTVITPVIEGTQVFLVEVQALVNKTSFGYPRRIASGFANQRLEIILAVLSKKLKLPLNSYDVYINIAGGLNLTEPAVDLAVATAIISAYYDKSFTKDSLIFGEIGLAGELRPVVKTKERIKEAIKLGFKNVYLPELNIKLVTDKIDINQLPTLHDLLKLLK